MRLSRRSYRYAVYGDDDYKDLTDEYLAGRAAGIDAARRETVSEAVEGLAESLVEAPAGPAQVVSVRKPKNGDYGTLYCTACANGEFHDISPDAAGAPVLCVRQLYSGLCEEMDPDDDDPYFYCDCMPASLLRPIARRAECDNGDLLIQGRSGRVYLLDGGCGCVAERFDECDLERWLLAAKKLDEERPRSGDIRAIAAPRWRGAP